MGPFPLGALLDAARSIGDDVNVARLSPVAGALRPLLPEIAHVLPSLPEPLHDRAAERHRVFRGLVEVFASLGPAVLALEDVHWADEHTADFVSYLVAEQTPQLSLVLTFRGEEAAPGVRALTAKLPPSVSRAHVGLAPLDAEQTGELAAGVLGLDWVSTEFAAHLYERSGGLPFVIEELLALLQARGTLVRRTGGWARKALDELDVPAGIRDSILERLSRLSESARSVVQASAVLQTPVPATVLVATCWAGKRARRGVEEALDSGLLVEHGDAVGFRHALGAQAVYDGLLGTRRQELHARAATALGALDPVPLGQLAHHLRNAGRLVQWVETAEQAADQAVELGHDEEAVRLLEDVLRHASLPRDRRGRLAVKLGRAAAGTLHGAQERLALLSEVLEHDLAPVVRGELRFWLAVQLEQAGRRPQRRLLAEAVGELDGRPDLKARAMVALGYPDVPGVALAEHRIWLDRALEVLPTVDDPGLRYLVLGKVAMVWIGLGDPKWRHLTDRIVEATRGVPRHRHEVRAYHSIGTEACHAGHLETAEQLLSAAREGAVALGSRQLEVCTGSPLALVSYLRGAWDG
ncbi:MAG TPA: hypothetical protein VFY92_03450, partial [Hyphomicrobiaceae bacterium]|nr:hypothetical protein [Hyphomicrobiaceae bacterium]